MKIYFPVNGNAHGIRNSMTTSVWEIEKWLARYILYIVIMLAIYGAVRLDALGGDTPRAPTDKNGMLIPESPADRLARVQLVGKFNEGDVVESLQLVLLLSMVLAAGFVAVHHREVRSISILLGGVIGMAAIREQDYWFDQYAHGLWAVPVGLLAAALAAYAWRKRTELWPGLVRFVQTPGWGLLVSGGLIAMVFARLMGQKSLWNQLVESPRVARNLKNMVEESLETAGYALMLCAMIESVVYFHRRARHNKHP